MKTTSGIPGWRGDWLCADPWHQGKILKRCADCGKIATDWDAIGAAWWDIDPAKLERTIAD